MKTPLKHHKPTKPISGYSYGTIENVLYLLSEILHLNLLAYSRHSFPPKNSLFTIYMPLTIITCIRDEQMKEFLPNIWKGIFPWLTLRVPRGDLFSNKIFLFFRLSLSFWRFCSLKASDSSRNTGFALWHFLLWLDSILETLKKIFVICYYW